MCSRPCFHAHLRERVSLLQTSVVHSQSNSNTRNTRRHYCVFGKRRSHDERQRRQQHKSHARDVQVGANTRKSNSIECSTSDSITDFQRIDVSTPMVALGKFNALHLGHRELIFQASRAGYPCLLSFSGMSKILKRVPRPPLTAMVDRSRVLASWSSAMHESVTPIEIQIPFSKVRYLQPEEFFKVLVFDMGARGIVCGENYRFGYQAVGDADLMRKLGTKYDIPVQVVELVTTGDREIEMPSNETLEMDATIISSSKITSLLAGGHMSQVAQMLGRKYRLVADVSLHEPSSTSSVTLSMDSFLNMIPGAGKYQVVLSTSEHASTTAPSTRGGDGETTASESLQKGVAEVMEKEIVVHSESALDLKKMKLLSIDFA